MVIFSASSLRENETEPWERKGLAEVTCEVVSFLAVWETTRRAPQVTRWVVVCPEQSQHWLIFVFCISGLVLGALPVLTHLIPMIDQNSVLYRTKHDCKSKYLQVGLYRNLQTSLHQRTIREWKGKLQSRAGEDICNPSNGQRYSIQQNGLFVLF